MSAHTDWENLSWAVMRYTHESLKQIAVALGAHTTPGYDSDPDTEVANWELVERILAKIDERNATIAGLRSQLDRCQWAGNLLADLDRNAHGRHAGDVDSGDPTGVSQGNPHLPPGTVIGYSLSGDPYVMPHLPYRQESWEGMSE